MMAVDLSQHRVNYFKGSDPTKWQKGIQTSKAVLYKNVYRNIDLKVYGVESQVEYDWIVKAGANPNDIRFKYKDASKTRIDKEGNLVVETKFGKMIHKKPISYQVIEGEKVAVQSTFKKTGKNVYGFAVESYNKDYELIIDPMVAITYSTYLGGSDNDNWKWIGDGSGIAVDCEGYIYVSGYTRSTDFPRPIREGCYQCSNAGSDDMFITKFGPDGSYLVYSTYLGGSDLDRCYDIAIDANGYVYVPGLTYSDSFPGWGSLSLNGNRIAVLAVLDANGDLYRSWCVGGSGQISEYGDWAYGVAVKSLNDVYIVGYTDSNEDDDGFPVTSGAYQTEYRGGPVERPWDAFVCRINCETGILACTYLGDSGSDAGYAVDLDSSGNVYITGYTDSVFSIGCSSYQTTPAGQLDAFVAKFNPSLSDLLCFTYLGGASLDTSTSIAVDSSGIYVSGHTESTGFPVKCAIQDEKAASVDAFVTKFNPDLSDLVYSTYLGGDGEDRGWRLVIDDSDAVYLTGYTTSSDFPTQNAFQEDKSGSSDVFVTKIDPNGTHLVFSTYLGGVYDEKQGDIAIGCGDNPDVYVTGATNSDNFPVHNPYQCQKKGGFDAFVTRYTFSDCDPVLWTDKDLLTFSVKDDNTTSTQRFLIRNIGGGTLEWQVTENSPWITCSPPSGTNFGVVEVSLDNLANLNWGENTTKIIVSDPGAVNSPQTVYVTIWKYAAGSQTPGTNMPFGTFETPINGSNIQDYVSFTGWALDDIEVESVKIYCQADSTVTYLGDACFIEGARPDVWQVYPNYTNSYKAGWGFPFQTRCLNEGPYTFRAIARDKEGNQVILGEKTLTIAYSIFPFGDLCKPEPGEVASGCNYKIEGWALTPIPKFISLIEISIDGCSGIPPMPIVEFGDPLPSCMCKTFPGYCDNNLPGFHYYLDTMKCSNGLHTITCYPLDTESTTGSFGSRYFYVFNQGTINSVTESSNQASRLLTQITTVPIDDSEPFMVKKGVEKNTKPRSFHPDRTGHIYIQIKEMERIEVQLNAAAGTSNYTGYHVIGNYLMPLPVGSTLDKEKGIFYWLPGPGFMGSYQLVFIEEKPNGEMTKKFVNVKIAPGFMKGEK
jgi:hypothetical protein